VVAWPSSGGVDVERCIHLRGIKEMESRTSLVVQFRLRHQASMAGGMSLIPGWGSKILHATCQKIEKEKEKKCGITRTVYVWGCWACSVSRREVLRCLLPGVWLAPCDDWLDEGATPLNRKSQVWWRKSLAQI